MHVHVLFLFLTVGIFLTTPLNRSSDQSRAFRSTNCQSPRFVQQVYRVLFGHPILGWIVIVIASGRVFSGPSGAFPCESLCVCVFVFTASVSITSPVSIISFSICFCHSSERFPLWFKPGQRAVLPTFSRTFLLRFFPSWFHICPLVTRSWHNERRLRCRGLLRLGSTDHQCRFSEMLDPMTFHQPVVSQLGASFIAVGIRNEI